MEVVPEAGLYPSSFGHLAFFNSETRAAKNPMFAVALKGLTSV